MQIFRLFSHSIWALGYSTTPMPTFLVLNVLAMTAFGATVTNSVAITTWDPIASGNVTGISQVSIAKGAPVQSNTVPSTSSLIFGDASVSATVLGIGSV